MHFACYGPHHIAAQSCFCIGPDVTSAVHAFGYVYHSDVCSMFLYFSCILFRTFASRCMPLGISSSGAMANDNLTKGQGNGGLGPLQCEIRPAHQHTGFRFHLKSQIGPHVPTRSPKIRLEEITKLNRRQEHLLVCCTVDYTPTPDASHCPTCDYHSVAESYDLSD